jgi:3-mercaptopyruvate sulfurtransferase SseA
MSRTCLPLTRSSWSRHLRRGPHRQDPRALHEGPRGAVAVRVADVDEHGHERVEVLEGGLTAWAEAGLPVEGETEPATA